MKFHSLFKLSLKWYKPTSVKERKCWIKFAARAHTKQAANINRTLEPASLTQRSEAALTYPRVHERGRRGTWFRGSAIVVAEHAVSAWTTKRARLCLSHAREHALQSRSFLRWDISIICPIAWKFTVTVFAGLHFRTLWPNRLNFFGHFKTEIRSITRKKQLLSKATLLIEAHTHTHTPNPDRFK